MWVLKSLFALFLLLASNLSGDAHILVYHRFDEPKYASTNTSTKTLKSQLEYLRDNGYEVISLDRLVLALQNKEEVGQKWVVLAVDDGYKSFYEKGLPIFREFGYPFVLFVYAKASDEGYGDYMSFKEIKEASKYGEIGLHSYSHSHLVSLDDNGVRADFTKGVDVFKKHMGYEPKYYAYPYGEYSPRVQSIAKEFGFLAIFNQNTGAISNESPLDDLDRVPVSELTPMPYALSSEFLKASWELLPNAKNRDYIQGVRIDTFSKAQTAKFFASGMGDFRQVSLNDGVFEYSFKKPISRHNTRMILKIKQKTTSKIFTKDHYAK